MRRGGVRKDGCAAAGSNRCSNLAIVKFDGSPCSCQTDTKSACLRAASYIYPVEGAKYRSGLRQSRVQPHRRSEKRLPHNSPNTNRLRSADRKTEEKCNKWSRGRYKLLHSFTDRDSTQSASRFSLDRFILDFE